VLACVLTSLIAFVLLVAMDAALGQIPARADSTFAAPANDFVAAIYTDVVDLDPALTTDANSLMVSNQIFETLLAYQPGTSMLTPSLAISWTASLDGLAWIFEIHPGVMFHDGTPLDAAAVAFNLQRWWDPANPYHDGDFEFFSGLFGGFKGDPGCLISGISALNDTQVLISLTRPYNPLPSMLTVKAFAIASPRAIQAGTLSTFPIGSGPFRFIAHTPGETISLEANPNYWGERPILDTLTFQVIPDDAGRYAALEAGIVYSVGDLPNNYALQAVDDPRLQVKWRPAIYTGYLGINRAHFPLDNILVRQAIAHAIDKPTLIDNHYSIKFTPASQFMPPMIWGHNPNLPGYTYEPALSISLLETAGFTEGFTTTLSYRGVERPYLPDPAGTASALGALLQVVGIQATVIEYESSEFLEKWKLGELDLFLLGWGADYLHPDNFFSPNLCNPELLGFGDLDTELCDLLEAAQAEPDFDNQVIAYQAASQRVYETLPLAPLVYGQSAILMRFNVEGLEPSPFSVEAYRSVRFADGEQIAVSPDSGGTLVHFDDQSQPTIIAVPAGAVTETTLLRYIAAEPGSVPAGLHSAHHGFQLSAHRDGEILDEFAFLEPVTFTVYYSDSDISGLNETILALYYWNGSRWQDAATTCDPASTYTRDLAANRIDLPVCHLTQFGLFGAALPQFYLPIVLLE
jgi:peptide/nickel transport system substrate-binding protein